MAGGPTPADLNRLTSAVKALTHSIEAMGRGMQAMNTNLVAIHEVLKEKTDD